MLPDTDRVAVIVLGAFCAMAAFAAVQLGIALNAATSQGLLRAMVP